MPYFSFRSFNCSSFFFVSIFWKACRRVEKTQKTKLRLESLCQGIHLHFLKIQSLYSETRVFVLTSTEAYSMTALWPHGDYRRCDTHTYSVCVVVEDHQVTVADVEAWQMVTGILGIKDVFINHVGCSSCFRCVSPERQGREKHTGSDYKTHTCRVQHGASV